MAKNEPRWIGAMKTFLLLVTWIIHNQAPSNYQVAFASIEACDAAQLKVINDAERMRQEAVERLRREGDADFREQA